MAKNARRRPAGVVRAEGDEKTGGNIFGVEKPGEARRALGDAPVGVDVDFEGDVVDVIHTMTGTINAPAPYQMVTVEVALLKTQSFADAFKQTLELNAIVGPFVIRPDSSTLSNYYIQNGTIFKASPGRLNGKSADFVVGLRGFYLVNATLFDTN